MARKPNLDTVTNREEENIPYRSGKKDYEKRELDAYHDNLIRRSNLGNLYIDLSKRPEGVVYCWAIKYTMGEDRSNDLLKEYLDRGWRTVPKSRHPELGTIDQAEAAKLGIRTDDSIIERKGMILMERDWELQKIENDFWLNQGRDRYKSTMKIHHNRGVNMDDPMQPRVIEDSYF